MTDSQKTTALPRREWAKMFLWAGLLAVWPFLPSPLCWVQFFVCSGMLGAKIGQRLGSIFG